MKIALTSDQWAAFGRDIRDDPKRSAVQQCCGNISALRDVVLEIHANGGEVSSHLAKELAEKWEWCRRGHGFDEVKYPTWNTLKSLITQAGLTWH